MIARHVRSDRDRTSQGELKLFQNVLQQIDWRESFHQPGKRNKRNKDSKPLWVVSFQYRSKNL